MEETEPVSEESAPMVLLTVLESEVLELVLEDLPSLVLLDQEQVLEELELVWVPPLLALHRHHQLSALQ